MGKLEKQKKKRQTLARSTRIPTSRTRSAAAGRLRARPSLLRQGKKASGCPNPDGREVYIFPLAVCCTQRASVYRQIKEIHVCFYPKHAGSLCSAPLGCKQRHRFAGRGRGTQTQVAAELLQLRGTKQLSFNCTKLPAHHFLFFSRSTDAFTAAPSERSRSSRAGHLMRALQQRSQKAANGALPKGKGPCWGADAAPGFWGIYVAPPLPPAPTPTAGTALCSPQPAPNFFLRSPTLFSAATSAEKREERAQKLAFNILLFLFFFYFYFVL